MTSMHGCEAIVFPPQAGQTVTVTGQDQTNYGARGVSIVVDITVNAGSSGSITLTIQGKDQGSGKYYTLLASAALTAVATTRYTVFPGNTVAANVSANDQLPFQWRLLVTANNANPVTYTVGGSTLA